VHTQRLRGSRAIAKGQTHAGTHFHDKTVVIPALVPALLATAAVAHADLPPGGKLVGTVPVSTPRDVESGFGSIWVANGPSRTVTRIDPSTDAVLAVISVPDPASVLAAGAGAIWLTSFPGDSLTQHRPTHEHRDRHGLACSERTWPRRDHRL
jgi:hypothetical protein